VLLPPGFDHESGILALEKGVVVRPDMPVTDAFAFLKRLLREFPFDDRKPDGTSRSESVVISAMLTVYGIHLLDPLDCPPFFMMVANEPGAGKSLLGRVAICPAHGPPRVRFKDQNNEELRKDLASAAIDNDPYYFLDDLEGRLHSEALNAFGTSSTVGGRTLGRLGGGFSAQKQCVVVITGNNLKPSVPIERRSLRAGLVEVFFDADERKIEHPINEKWLCDLRNRGDILSALWALVRDYDEKGRPRQGGRMVKSYEDWCAVIPPIVMHAGFGDPCERQPLEAQSGATERADLQELIEAMYEALAAEASATGVAPRRREFIFREVATFCEAGGCFAWALDGAVMKTDKEGREYLDLLQKMKARLGDYLTDKFVGQKITLRSGVRLSFDKMGSKRGRRYVIEVL
jgi:hypothetical protein